MSDNKTNNPSERGQLDISDTNLASPTEVSNVAESVKTSKTSQHTRSSSDRQIKFERAQKCLENAALVSKRIKEHRKATAELLGRPFEEDDGDTASEMASTMSEKTGYSVATDTSTTMSVQDALNIPGISESLANTLKQKELLMERIKQYKEISKRPMTKPATTRRESFTDTKVEVRKPKSTDNSDVTQLINTIKEKENSLSVMQVKIKALETTVLDLQEKINEKDQIIEAKNKATTLMSDSLSKKEKDSLVLLEDTRQQMLKMQENFIAMETEWKEEKNKLLKDIEKKDEKISSLEEANTILETARFDISLAHSQLTEELELKNQEILSLHEKIESLSQVIEVESPKERDDIEEEKGSLEIAGMAELTKKIELLEQLNCQIRQTNKELENKLANIHPEPKATASAAGKKGSPLPTRKGGRNTAAKSKSPWSQLSSESLPQETDKKAIKSEITRLEMLVQSLNKDILDKEYAISQKESLISELQATVLRLEERPVVVTVEASSSTDMTDVTKANVHTETEPHLEETIKDTVIEGSIEELNVQELVDKLKAAEEQIMTLNNDIDAANKNMIKVKSNNKLKLKQLQKTIDNFSKVSDSNTEIVKLNEELHQLSQKVAELEEEKGNLQLHLVDYDSGRLTDSDIYKKMVEMENLAEARLKSISVLEAQKFDLVQELHVLQQKNEEMEDKLADISQLQSEHVCTEMKSVQLEEQIDELIAAKKELELVIENIKLDKEHLNESIKLLQDEKEELSHKLENYIQENIELTDKLEKLSAEKVSSAESIEIVESLTTQEKLELEEYNKGVTEDKEPHDEIIATQTDRSIDSLIEQREELNKKIELYTIEREEVMEKMHKRSAENESLAERIAELNNENITFQSNIDKLNTEKQQLQDLNRDLTQQLDELKHERIEIVKETAEVTKSPPSEDTLDGVPIEACHDDKSAGDKGTKGAKTVKQLTKEILKLKNTIKEREDEIADCQMKILSLEEQQEKQNELLQVNVSHQNRIKSLTDENYYLKQQLEFVNKDREAEQQLMQMKQANDLLQQEIHKVNHEYSVSIGARDSRINELENVLLEYEKQIYNYSNNLQQKDKEMAEYINQITKLNDVSQKLKSTIDLLEEEKAKDQNAELVRSLNKQIAAYQKKLMENEEKLKAIEEEKHQLHCLKGDLVNKNTSLESELNKLKDAYAEKQALIKELQIQKQAHKEEMSSFLAQNKERDEEIHEIKLQLRKESIENEKLRNNVADKESLITGLTQQIEELKEKLNNLSSETNSSTEQYTVLENKNKELMEKLKKFAISMKKKSALYNELEVTYAECQNQVIQQNQQLEQLMIQVETLPALQEKIKHADEEINRLQSQKIALEQQRSRDTNQQQTEIIGLQEQLSVSAQEISQLHDSIITLQRDLSLSKEENINLKSQVDSLNNKLVEYEIELKNNINLATKITSLETDINQKQAQIDDLLNKVEQYEQHQNQVQFGYDAKMQERDLFIENLEAEIYKYKSRICRLEESISIMEDRRHSLERKADQLGSQLQEKQKAYSEYTNQEDELVSRLAVLIDHDRVLEKQLIEIDSENRELQSKLQHFNEDNQRLKKSLSDIQGHYNTLIDKANKVDNCESEVTKYQNQLREVEGNLKRITHDHQSLIIQKKQEIEELEFEFNTQIENALKEKKSLNEKYEKINEYVAQLEAKLQEYQTNIETLNLNIMELNRVNQELTTESINRKETSAPDYTEQYISEINRLNSMVNQKSEEIKDLTNKIHQHQSSSVSVVSNLESKISDLSAQLNQTLLEIERLYAEMNSLQNVNQELQSSLVQKEEQIKELKDTKKLTFEMNIPKTEGMLISSTIESMGDDNSGIDMLGIESQILPSTEELPLEDIHVNKKVTEHLQKQTDASNAMVEEPIIVAKKAYVCYNEEANDEPPVEVDPFNSDEGWGFGENEEVAEIAPGFSHLNNQILELKKENDALKTDLEANSAKLLKAIKKLKELKSANEMLTNELKMAKQMSQASFFDNAIEDELRSNIKDLESKVEELKTEINKEKRDKESLRKQNDVFHNANDRLTEMKEKLDNEIELWKFKFKEANDKVSTLQWGGESKEIQPQEHPIQTHNASETRIKEELMKVEKENDELQSIVDQLNLQNKELLAQHSSMKQQLDSYSSQMQQQACDNCERLSKEILELSKRVDEVTTQNTVIKENLQRLETFNKKLSEEYERSTDVLKLQLENEKSELVSKHTELEAQFVALKKLQAEYEIEKSALLSNLEDVKSKLLWQEQQHIDKHSEDSLALHEKYHAMEQQCLEMKTLLDEANKKLYDLESENQTLTTTSKDYQEAIDSLNSKIEQLNIENDTLLSTVAELRSSVSSAVDQRGFEIAELWKQHLAQREADFQKLESDLRSQISTSEAKYDQLLTNVQSTDQEETNTLIMMEQVNSLQSKLEDKEEHVRNLQSKYSEVVGQLDMLRSEMEDERVANENKLLEQQEEYEKLIQDYKETIKTLDSDVVDVKSKNDDLNKLKDDLQDSIIVLEEQVMDLTNQLSQKESEIYQHTPDLTLELAQRNEEFENVRQLLLEYEKKIEDLTFEKESELAVLRLQIHKNEVRYNESNNETEKEKESLIDLLNAKVIECTNLNKQIVDLNKELEEKSTKFAEMEAALENQEIEIVGLKDEIVNLQSLIQTSSAKIQKHVSFSSDTKTGDIEQDSAVNKNLLDAVPRAELDLALYMLHQRDVRCEELTMELTQLLEERDTLQLRLSDSLRVSEDLKTRCKTAGIDDSFTSSQETISELPSFSVEKEFVDVHRGNTSRSSSISDPDGEKPKLQAKLSELRSVKHSRDVWLRHESEQRQLDLRLLQRDVANLPPEAVDQLAQAHHTLSRDSQSTSTVLLNWLRGKSTPKAVQNM